ncbi:NARF domain-containing protein [Sphingobacterium sp. 2149]|uniref:NARF domain-containing protein n=1 Tax=Sphingobacterium sp. 2149 TaxID=2817763 RepID=UPI00286ABA27|nr:NARF domain-containing protein [Sphingobacterium sp. 2149]
MGGFTELPDHDLMVFNMPNGELSQQQVDQLMAMNNDEDTHYVAYLKGRLEPNDRLNFSNSPFTLYHNILSTLKYAEVVKLIEQENV